MYALLTDLYELNMAASYLRRGMTAPATFSLFVRRMPEQRGFLVSAGIESCLDLLEAFRFDEESIDYLRETLGFPSADLEAFRRLRFTGDVWAIPEGRVALAGEPLVEVTAPLPEAQLIETLMLNRITFETTIASKAVRCVIAAGGRDVVDFAFRRTQGIEAGLDVARLSAIAGFVATSNVEAARRNGLVAAGTMAHSYIEAFPSESAAFSAFAHDFPDRTTFLVDTYDTLAGVKDAIAVIKELGLGGQLGIRLDSGDLGQLAKRSRRLLDQAGLRRVRIFASGGLDELAIDALVRSGAPIDAFGVGTKMGVSADDPYLDTAYKLVCYAGRPVMKLAQGKVTAPGRKQVFRRRRPFGDLIGLFEETVSGREALLEPLMLNGIRTGERSHVADSRARLNEDLADLPDDARRLRSPQAPQARMTAALRRLMAETRRQTVARVRTRVRLPKVSSHEVRKPLAGSIARLLAERPPVGVRFLEHTADTAIEVHARSLEACFARVAAGMFAVFTAPAEMGASMQRVEVNVIASGPKELLVAWLEELLYLSEVKGLGLEAFTVSQVLPNRVIGSAVGSKFGPHTIVIGPAVKGVSRSGLQLHRSGANWLARVIFDV